MRFGYRLNLALKWLTFGGAWGAGVFICLGALYQVRIEYQRQIRVAKLREQLAEIHNDTVQLKTELRQLKGTTPRSPSIQCHSGPVLRPYLHDYKVNEQVDKNADPSGVIAEVETYFSRRKPQR